MKKSIKTTVCALMAMLMLVCSLPTSALAAAVSGETAATTPTSAAAPTVVLDQLRVKGSNNKIYLSTPNLSNDVNAYSFGVPNWMETATITFVGAAGMAATCSNGQSVVSTGTNYSVGVELTENKQTVTISLSKDGLSRNVEVTINRRQIDCYIEDIMVFSGDTEIIPQGEAGDGTMTFALPSGTLQNVSLRVKPRHENVVTIANTTNKLDGETVTEGEKKQLKINQYSTYYPVNLCDTDLFDPLVEGTNKYYVEVTAGSITRTCNVIIVVGDPAANATTTTTTTTTEPTTTTTTVPTVPTASQTLPNNQGGSSGGSVLKSIPTVLWVLIGIIALVVIGSCIFMIVNMTSSNRRNAGGYNNYDYDYGPQPRRRRRNLTEYLDDEYDDYGYDRGRGGRYDDYGYDDYDQPPRRGGRHDSYDYDNYDNYDQQPRRRGFEDYDDYDDGYGGGY